MPRSINVCLPCRQAQLFFISLLFLTLSCSGGGGGASLRVLAASSLTEAFNDVAQAFEAENPGVAVKLDFGGSQRLRSQLEFGARADVFASADRLQMDLLVAADLIGGTPADFASNELVVIAMAKGPVHEISDLVRPGVRVVLAQSSVPVGSYSRQVLGNLAQDGALGLGSRFLDDVLANLVSEEPNVRNVVQKVALGEVDAGIVYQTDASAAHAAGDIRVIPIPAAANVSVRYPIAVLEDAPEMELAHGFVRFVLSEAGQRLLKGHGFRSP